MVKWRCYFHHQKLACNWNFQRTVHLHHSITIPAFLRYPHHDIATSPSLMYIFASNFEVFMFPFWAAITEVLYRLAEMLAAWGEALEALEYLVSLLALSRWPLKAGHFLGIWICAEKRSLEFEKRQLYLKWGPKWRHKARKLQ